MLPIAGDNALEIARKEGTFTGITVGATFARADEPGAQILCMLPDTVERYLSTVLFEDIPVDMSDEEIEISRLTPPSTSMPAHRRRPRGTQHRSPLPAPTATRPSTSLRRW